MGVFVQEVLDEDGNVLASLAQGRQDEGNDVETIEEVLQEPAVLHQPLDVAVGRGDHAHVHLLAALRAQGLELALLQDAQELGLQGRAHGPDLVQEDGAAVGEGELALLVGGGPVKAPRTWPNSSDSSRVSGMAAQFTLMSGMSRCALRSWMARASSSLPVPVSPMMSTVLLVSATRSALRDHVLDRAAAPTMP